MAKIKFYIKKILGIIAVPILFILYILSHVLRYPELMNTSFLFNSITIIFAFVFGIWIGYQCWNANMYIKLIYADEEELERINNVLKLERKLVGDKN